MRIIDLFPKKLEQKDIVFIGFKAKSLLADYGLKENCVVSYNQFPSDFVKDKKDTFILFKGKQKYHALWLSPPILKERDNYALYSLKKEQYLRFLRAFGMAQKMKIVDKKEWEKIKQMEFANNL